MPNKPVKFGIKFWLVTDVQSKYLVNASPYLGKDEQRPSNLTLCEHVVLKLCDPFLRSGCCCTMDNFFSSLKLAKALQKLQTSMVVTIRTNKREVPQLAKTRKDKLERYASRIYRHEGCTLTIYKSKLKKKFYFLVRGIEQ